MGPEKPIHYVGGFHTDAAASCPITPDDGDGVRGRRRARRHRRTGHRAGGPGARRSEGRLYQRLLPKPGLATNPLDRSSGRQRTDRPVRLPGDSRGGSSRLDHRDGDCEGGRAYFLATICDLLGHGRVLSVDPGARRGVPTIPASRTSPVRPTSPASSRGARHRRQRSTRSRDPWHTRTAGPHAAGVRSLCVDGPGRLLRGRRAHRTQWLPDRRVLRTRARTRPCGGS